MKTSAQINHALAAVILVSALAVTGCQKNVSAKDATATGISTVSFYLTDDPSLTFDQVLLDMQKVEIKVEDNEQLRHEGEHQGESDDNDHKGDTSGGWISIGIHPGIYDLLRFRNGLDTLFATGSFPAVRALKKIRVTLGSSNSVVLNGNSFPLTTKDNDNIIVIKTEDYPVKINSGSLSIFSIDIDAANSIKQHGHDFELKPSVKLFSKDVTGRIEGRVLPKDAAAVVMAINGTDTTSAKPSEGEFKLAGLKAGVYSVLYHATAGNYKDTTINNIIVKTKEDSKLPAVILHQ